jgi:hypothetical protein
LDINYRNWCPVGSVEFVHRYFNKFNIPVPKPINIPRELWQHSNLNPYILEGECSIGDVFAKNCDFVKHPDNGYVKEKLKTGLWQITDYLKNGFVSEWRCFVFNGKLLDCKIYSGDYNYLPNEFYIAKAIELWKNAPPSYTLDLGVLDAFYYNTCVIECHNFYSCGLYGFSNRLKYPQMLAQWYAYWMKKNNV